MKKTLLLSILVLLLSNNKVLSQSTQIGTNPSTALTLFEYYNHIPSSEWIKVFKVKNSTWHYGGVSGSLYFIDYQGEGASRIDFIFPQSINPNQKPQLKFVGNSSRDILWYVLPSLNNDYYEVYIKTPIYHVGLTFLFRSYEADVFITPEVPPSQNWSWTSILNPESIQTELGNGNVGIGTINPTSKLTVAGTIASREVKVTVDAGADFVFENDYNLPSLDSVANYIKENKHLPEIASAEEMKKDGINLSEMNIKLLKKIEEMTLYMIEMKKENNRVKNENENIKNNQLKLDQRVKAIENR